MSIEGWNENVDSHNLEKSKKERYISKLGELFDNFSGDEKSSSRKIEHLEEKYIPLVIQENIEMVVGVISYIYENIELFPKHITNEKEFNSLKEAYRKLDDYFLSNFWKDYGFLNLPYLSMDYNSDTNYEEFNSELYMRLKSVIHNDFFSEKKDQNLKLINSHLNDLTIDQARLMQGVIGMLPEFPDDIHRITQDSHWDYLDINLILYKRLKWKLKRYFSSTKVENWKKTSTLLIDKKKIIQLLSRFLPDYNNYYEYNLSLYKKLKSILHDFLNNLQFDESWKLISHLTKYERKLIEKLINIISIDSSNLDIDNNNGDINLKTYRELKKMLNNYFSKLNYDKDWEIISTLTEDEIKVIDSLLDDSDSLNSTETSKLPETLSENDVRNMLWEYRKILWNDMVVWADKCSIWAIWTGLTKVNHHYFWEYNHPQKTTFFVYSPSKNILVEIAVKTEEWFDRYDFINNDKLNNMMEIAWKCVTLEGVYGNLENN